MSARIAASMNGTSAFAAACIPAVALWLAAAVWAGPPAGTPVGKPYDRSALPSSEGASWQSLSAAERRALAPLERDWSQMSAEQKLKWVEMAHRLPTLSHEQQQRIQSRMADWARMSPAERGEARLRFLQAQRTAVDERERRWEDYQALPSDRKKQFAARAAAPAASQPADPRKQRADASVQRGAGERPATKSNLVPNPNFAAQPRAIAPMTLKAGTGASTTLVTKPPAPPPHQQTGLPKIAASPSLIDRTTLLPKRGPQGAAAAPVIGDEDADPMPRP